MQGSPIVQLLHTTPRQADFLGHIKYSISTYCSHILKTFLAQYNCISIVYMEKYSQNFKLPGIHITGNFRDPIELGLLLFCPFPKILCSDTLYGPFMAIFFQV